MQNPTEVLLNTRSNLYTASLTRDPNELPDFVAARIEAFYEKRVKEKWGNQPVLVGDILQNRDSILINTNDYLSLGQNKDLLSVQAEALLKFGNGQMMSALLLDNEHIQSRFEETMADFLGVETTLTYQSGYCANVGLLQSIASEATPVYIDALAHASLWEGIKAAKARPIPFAHNNVSHLVRKVKSNGPGVILVDSIYSTNGDLCPLKEIAQVATEFKCVFVVDESHSLGLYGVKGEGLVAELGLNKKVHFITASLAKTFCGRGGIITCSKRTKGYLNLNSFPTVFSSAVSIADVAGFLKAIEIIKNGSEDRKRLRTICRTIKLALKEMNFDISDIDTPIIALKAGSEKNVIILRDFFNRHNIFGSVFVPPATSEKTTCYRLTLNASLKDEDVEKIISICGRLRTELCTAMPALFHNDFQALK